VAAAAGFNGEIAWDSSKPDGMPRKCLDVTRMTAAGFAPKITLKQGVAQMISLYGSIATP
jgi:GDP-L-fucose synthase